MTKQVLSVGQCGPDHASLCLFIETNFDAKVTGARLPDDTFAELDHHKFDLILINRKLDADYSDGLEIVKSLKEDPRYKSVPVMLVTNYCEYQDQAVAAGAVRGFGKLEFCKPETAEKLRPFLS